MTAARPFGRMQVAALEAIRDAGINGITPQAALGLRGKAKDLSARYDSSLRNAITAHNAGSCPANCPIHPNLRIVEGPFGPHGGKRWCCEADPPASVTA